MVFGFVVLFICSFEASRGAWWAVCSRAADTASLLSSVESVGFLGLGVRVGEGGRRGAGAIVVN